MFMTTHGITGAFIGSLLPTHPVAAFFLAFGAHFIEDIIPHGDTGLYKGYVAGTHVKRAVVFISMDVLIVMGVLAYFFFRIPATSHTAVMLGMAGGILPDALVSLYELLRIDRMRWFHRIHFFFHNLVSGRIGDMPLYAGFLMEVTLCVGMLAVIF